MLGQITACHIWENCFLNAYNICLDNFRALSCSQLLLLFLWFHRSCYRICSKDTELPRSRFPWHTWTLTLYRGHLLLSYCPTSLTLGDLPGKNVEQHQPSGYWHTQAMWLQRTDWLRQTAQPKSITSYWKAIKCSCFTMEKWFPCWLIKNNCLPVWFNTQNVPVRKIWGNQIKNEDLRKRVTITWRGSLSQSFWTSEATCRRVWQSLQGLWHTFSVGSGG